MIEALALEPPDGATAAVPCGSPKSGSAEGGGLGILLIEELLVPEELEFFSLEEEEDGTGRPVRRSTDG